MYKAIPNFNIKILDEALEFIGKLDKKVRKKIANDMDKARYELNDSVFKKLGNSGIWEFRTSYMRIEYRLLAFWDTSTNSLVVATHGFVKKTQKTPDSEIAKAQKIRDRYYNQK